MWEYENYHFLFKELCVRDITISFREFSWCLLACLISREFLFYLRCMTGLQRSFVVPAIHPLITWKSEQRVMQCYRTRAKIPHPHKVVANERFFFTGVLNWKNWHLDFQITLKKEEESPTFYILTSWSVHSFATLNQFGVSFMFLIIYIFAIHLGPFPVNSLPPKELENKHSETCFLLFFW